MERDEGWGPRCFPREDTEPTPFPIGQLALSTHLFSALSITGIQGYKDCLLEVN